FRNAALKSSSTKFLPDTSYSETSAEEIVARSRTRTIANKSEIGQTKRYQHPEFDMALRPEVGTQPQFRKRRPPATYRYDSSLSPSLEWDGKNPVRNKASGCWL